MNQSSYQRRKEREKSVNYILKHNVKIVAQHYLSNPNLSDETSAYWRGYYDAMKCAVSLLSMEQTRLEEICE